MTYDPYSDPLNNLEDHAQKFKVSYISPLMKNISVQLNLRIFTP